MPCLSLFSRDGKRPHHTRVRPNHDHLLDPLALPVTLYQGWHASLNEHLCPIRRHKRLKYMQAARSSSQRIRRSKSWYHMHELGRPSRQSRQWMLRVYYKTGARGSNKDSGLREGRDSRVPETGDAVDALCRGNRREDSFCSLSCSRGNRWEPSACSAMFSVEIVNADNEIN